MLLFQIFWNVLSGKVHGGRGKSWWLNMIRCWYLSLQHFVSKKCALAFWNFSIGITAIKLSCLFSEWRINLQWLKNEFGGNDAKDSSKMKFFYPSATLREKYSQVYVNIEYFSDITITGEFWQLFRWWSKSECDTSRFSERHLLPSKLQRLKWNFCIIQKGERSLRSRWWSKVYRQMLLLYNKQIKVYLAINHCRFQDQIQLFWSTNSHLFISSVHGQWINLNMSAIADLLVVGLKNNNKDSLPENPSNEGTMKNCAFIWEMDSPDNLSSSSGSKWSNRYRKCPRMNWEIIVKADEFELFGFKYLFLIIEKFAASYIWTIFSGAFQLNFWVILLSKNSSKLELNKRPGVNDLRIFLFLDWIFIWLAFKGFQVSGIGGHIWLWINMIMHFLGLENIPLCGGLDIYIELNSMIIFTMTIKWSNHHGWLLYLNKSIIY